MLNTEAIMDRFRSILVEDLPAEIDAENALHSDFSLADLGEEQIHLEAVPDGGFLSPYVVIVERDPEPGEVEAETMKAPIYQLEVYVFDEDADLETLKRRLWRYRRAIANTLLAHQNEADELWFGLNMRAADPQPVVPPGEFGGQAYKTWSHGKGVRFTVETIEEYPG